MCIVSDSYDRSAPATYILADLERMQSSILPLGAAIPQTPAWIYKVYPAIRTLMAAGARAL